ncbi:MAG: hypothetical protein GQ570_13450 [Helicobacteraceae bacterium]|nr:hypothetical protein [Helicobacteraceae bacterium]
MKESIKKLLQISDVSYYRWRKERQIFDLLETYFVKEELEEFLKSGKIEKFDLIKDVDKDTLKKQLQLSSTNEIDPSLEEYIVINLKRFHKLDRGKLFNLFFPSSEFITRNLKKIETIINLNDLSISNARIKFNEFLTKATLNKVLDTELKRKKILEEINTEYVDLELYVILKHRRKFI